ncbi:uncharacterized protein LOC134543091 [Bacillus rossius redtenbacheri]|uniref:uncharacterized protein LOC134543091 n=1 Tax=Bacillus rossius redtenbacheri TaxID=93214 RepID=UPI002FDCC124
MSTLRYSCDATEDLMQWVNDNEGSKFVEPQTLADIMKWSPDIRNLVLKKENDNHPELSSKTEILVLEHNQNTDQFMKPNGIGNNEANYHDINENTMLLCKDVKPDFGNHSMGSYPDEASGTVCRTCSMHRFASCSAHGSWNDEMKSISGLNNIFEYLNKLQTPCKDEPDTYPVAETPHSPTQVTMPDRDNANNDYCKVRNDVVELVDREFAEIFGVCQKKHDGDNTLSSICDFFDFPKELAAKEYKPLQFQKIKFYSELTCKLLACFEEVYLQLPDNNTLKNCVRKCFLKKLHNFDLCRAPRPRRQRPTVGKTARSPKHPDALASVFRIPSWTRRRNKTARRKGKKAKTRRKKQTPRPPVVTASRAASEIVSDVDKDEVANNSGQGLVTRVSPSEDPDLETPTSTLENDGYLESVTFDVESRREFYALEDGEGLRGFSQNCETADGRELALAELDGGVIVAPEKSGIGGCSLPAVDEGSRAPGEDVSAGKETPKPARSREAARGGPSRKRSPRTPASGRSGGATLPSRNWSELKEEWSSQRVRRRGINQDTVRKLESILSAIKNMREADFILKYDMSKEVPSYPHTNPMNLMEISSKLRRRIYETVEQAVHDFRRILYNIRRHYELGEQAAGFLADSCAIGRRFDALLAENFGGRCYRDVSGDPEELRTNPVLRYRVWDLES